MSKRHHGSVFYWFITILAAMLATTTVAHAAEQPKTIKADETPPQRIGLYLHACWAYRYPFAVRTWRRADYDAMFQLLRHMGYDAVMLWPVLETVPAPLSAADRATLGEFRAIVNDARRRGLETWLTQCAALTCKPEIASIPWPRRSLYGGLAQTVRLDEPGQAEPYFQHRAALMKILNNADGYVTIDGDPGGYAGATPDVFLEVFRRDRRAIDRFGTHPRAQKLIPWIWCGWGTKGVWVEPIEPFVAASLETLEKGMPEPWELLPGRSREGHANDRLNVELARKAGLFPRSTLFLYEAIEYEPSIPAAVLQFDEIRAAMKKELELAPAAKGWFGNVQTPVMVLPNVYFFARAAREPSYLDRSDEDVLTDFAEFLGGPPDLLAPAWSCLRLGLDQLPIDLPERLRRVKLSGRAAAFLPGGATQYLDLLARQVDARLRLLRACGRPPETERETVTAVVEGTAALVDWWKTHRYVQGADGDEPFRWRFVHRSQYQMLRNWCKANVAEPQGVMEKITHAVVERELLTRPIAEKRLAELLAR